MTVEARDVDSERKNMEYALLALLGIVVVFPLCNAASEDRYHVEMNMQKQ